MTELQPLYDREVFPYAGILEDLTPEIRDHRMSPVEAYANFASACRGQGLEGQPFDYNSTAITSGGHARLPGAEMAETILNNTETARQIMRLLAAKGDVIPRESLLPVDVGNTGWRQAEFMEFWLLAIARPDIRELRNNQRGFGRLERNIGNAISSHGAVIEVMNNGTLSVEERRGHYQRFGAAITSAVRTSGLSCSPARRFNKLVDTGVSLGCDTEDDFAGRMGIPKNRLVAVEAVDNLALPIPSLNEDLMVMRQYGAEVLVPSAVVVAERGQMLTLVKEA